MTSNDGLNDDSTIHAVGVMMRMPASTSCTIFSRLIQDSLSGVPFICSSHQATAPRRRLKASTAPNTIAVRVSINALAYPMLKNSKPTRKP